MLDEIGLSSALRWYIDGLTERSGLSIELDIPDNLERLAPEMELAIFRLVQECLTNIHRHSGSKTAVVRVAREPDKIHVQVQDHGKGISQERLTEIQSQGVGVGIRGMRERVRQAQGELTVDSNALGTKITAVFPTKKRCREGTKYDFTTQRRANRLTPQPNLCFVQLLRSLLHISGKPCRFKRSMQHHLIR